MMNIKNNKGITLVLLIITILITILLAIIPLNLVINDDSGVINKADEASNAAKKAKEEEDFFKVTIEILERNPKITKVELENRLPGWGVKEKTKEDELCFECESPSQSITITINEYGEEVE